jgi:hypothetical protein
LRNRFEADFRWWDRVDQVLALPCFVLRGLCGLLYSGWYCTF